MNLSGAENKELWAGGARVMGDLVRHTMSTATWITRVNVPWLKSKLPPLPPVTPTMIQRGLNWRCSVTITPLKPGDMVAVLGWARNRPIWLVNFQRWTKHENETQLTMDS